MEKRQPLGILQEGHDLASTLKSRLAELEAVLHRPSQPDESAALEERLVEQSVEFERRRARFREQMQDLRDANERAEQRAAAATAELVRLKARYVAVVELCDSTLRALGDASGVDAAAAAAAAPMPPPPPRAPSQHEDETVLERPASSGGGPSTAPPPTGAARGGAEAGRGQKRRMQLPSRTSGRHVRYAAGGASARPPAPAPAPAPAAARPPPPPDEPPARGAGARRPLHALVPSLVQSQDGGSEASPAGASPPVAAAPLADPSMFQPAAAVVVAAAAAAGAPEPPPPRYHEVVRGKAERARMEAVDCPQCAAFFAGLDLSPGAMRRCQADCSRHRVQHQAAPGTQSSYWDMSFPEDRSDGGGTPR